MATYTYKYENDCYPVNIDLNGQSIEVEVGISWEDEIELSDCFDAEDCAFEYGTDLLDELDMEKVLDHYQGVDVLDHLLSQGLSEDMMVKLLVYLAGDEDGKV